MPLAAIVFGQVVSSGLVTTPELIANILGVRCEGVIDATSELQKLHVSAYAPGQITALDRQRLERLCCECYGVMKKETDRLRSRQTTSFEVMPRQTNADLARARC
jgi:hypothetical protein